jgi:hypothetical protein|tara:strand:+ start:1178 stop:1405 length:228 start_codon:yes stop_codon:yes gene_type:complete
MKIIKTKSALWMGNGMGTDTAEYSAVQDGKTIANIFSLGYHEWRVVTTDNHGSINKSFEYFKDARTYALLLGGAA